MRGSVRLRNAVVHLQHTKCTQQFCNASALVLFVTCEHRAKSLLIRVSLLDGNIALAGRIGRGHPQIRSNVAHAYVHASPLRFAVLTALRTFNFCCFSSCCCDCLPLLLLLLLFAAFCWTAARCCLLRLNCLLFPSLRPGFDLFSLWCIYA